MAHGHQDASETGPASYEATLVGTQAGIELPPRTVSGLERLEGRELGRYVVLGRIGAGAMGVVLAAYDPELDRKVALKLLHPRARHPGAHDGHLRLLAEAQALARLSDPHVVAVHDVGTHEGRVFVAMEFVEGQTLGRWLAQGPRPWREVLDVMLRAGRGLAAAHARELVHRDFKPDNVMIGDDGRVRVMDFGLAYADADTVTGPAELESSSPRQRALGLQLTHHGAMVGTPAYMAPEHVAGRRGGPAADQFSFCVTFWEALHGERPFRGDTLPDLYARILEGAIAEPSAGPRTPRWLRRVIQRGLAVDPEQRWPSMQALLEALERGRTAARRRRALGAGALVAAAAAAAWGVSRYDELRLRRACEAEGARIAAVWNDDVAEAARAAMVGSGAVHASITMDKARPWIDAYVQTWSEARTEACMRAEVEGSWDAATHERSRWCSDDRRLALQALVDALVGGDARVVDVAVQTAATLEPLGTCLDAGALSRMPMAPADRQEELAAVRSELSRVQVVANMGDRAEALALTERALAHAEALEWPPLVALAHFRLGSLLAKEGRHADAERSLERAYFDAARAEALDVALAAASGLVSLLGYEQARHDEALRWARHAELVLARLPDASELRRGPLLVNVSTVHYTRGSYAEAQAVAEQVLSLYEEAFGSHHPRVADALVNLGVFHAAQGEYAEAKALYERALAIREQALGPLHPDVYFVEVNLGSVELRLGELARAQARFERALAAREAVVGPEHVELQYVLNNLAAVHHERGELDRAKQLFARTLAVCEKGLGPEHPRTTSARTNYADTLRMLGELDEARAQFEQTLRTKEATLGPAHPDLGFPLQGLAQVAIQQGRPDDAVAFAERALRVREQGGVAPDLVAETRFVLADAQWQQGRDREAARALARRALEEHRDHGPGRADDVAMIERWLAEHPP